MASEWFYQVMGKPVGPVSGEELRDLARRGVITVETPVTNAPNGRWVPAERVKGLFVASNEMSPVKATTKTTQASSSNAATAKKSSGQEKLTKISLIVGCSVFILTIGFLVWFFSYDTWEQNNASRVSAKLEEANRLQQSDPVTAYKMYDEVLKETEQHKITDSQFVQKLADAEKSRTDLYPKFQEKIQAEEAEKQRLAEEKARRAAEEKHLKDAIAAYRNVPQSARDALNAVKKLEARTEVGINYENYSIVVGEAWADVKIFAESTEGKKLPAFSFLLVSAMSKYKLALDVWQEKVQGNLTISPANMLSGVLLQQCWRAANRRIDIAESLVVGEDVAAVLMRVSKLQKTDTDYEGSVRSILADLITLSLQMIDSEVHTTGREQKEIKQFSKRMDDIDKEDKQDP